MKTRPKKIRVKARIGVRGRLIFNGRYTVYEDGVIHRNRIPALGCSGCVRWLPRILLRGIMHKTYYHVSINTGTAALGLHPIHLLVCQAFIGPKPSPRHEVNHKDGCKTNNHWRNLEWVTRSGNQLHAANHGLKPVGEKSHLHKLKAFEVQKIRRMIGTISNRAIAARFGVSPTCIGDIALRRSWKQLPFAA